MNILVGIQYDLFRWGQVDVKECVIVTDVIPDQLLRSVRRPDLNSVSVGVVSQLVPEDQILTVAREIKPM